MYLFEVPLDDAGAVIVEIDEEDDGIVRAARPGKVAGRAAESLRDAWARIHPMAKAFADEVAKSRDGAGVLAGPDLIVTCAHVVAQALGTDAPAPAQRVRVDFPLLDGAGTAELPAEIVVWEPPRPGGAGDIAGLRLLAAPPSGVRMARLVLARDLWEHPFRAFGFPARRDDGVWAAGVLRERTAAGWLQAEHAAPAGFTVQPGFSGTPVWDDELQGVVGIVVAAEKRLALGTGYVIPSTTLLERWPALEPYTLAPCPYRGLAAFREEDARLFFGRDELIDSLAATVARSRVTTVLGPSGSGKSSLVAAGLLPRMRAEGATVAWMRPMGGATPTAACAAAFVSLLEPGMSEADRLAEVPKLAAVLLAGDRGAAADFLTHLRALLSSPRLLAMTRLVVSGRTGRKRRPPSSPMRR